MSHIGMNLSFVCFLGEKCVKKMFISFILNLLMVWSYTQDITCPYNYITLNDLKKIMFPFFWFCKRTCWGISAVRVFSSAMVLFSFVRGIM